MKLEEDKPSYDMVLDRNVLIRTLNDCMIDYNFGNAAKMNIVLY